MGVVGFVICIHCILRITVYYHISVGFSLMAEILAALVGMEKAHYLAIAGPEVQNRIGIQGGQAWARGCRVPACRKWQK